MSFLRKLFGKRKEPEVLLEAESPLCPITTIVEQDDRVAYMYVIGGDQTDFGVKACWIRNLDVAPATIDDAAPKEGEPPMQDRKSCRYTEGQPPLRKKDLSLVWTEEGDGVALLEGTEIIAIVPAWSGVNNFHGYARDAIGQGRFAWEIGSDNSFPERINRAKNFWGLWDTTETPFQKRQPEILDLYEKAFGKESGYYAIDGGHFPPRGGTLMRGPSQSVFLTVGLSIFPQPQIEMHVEMPETLNRIELGLILNNADFEGSLQGLTGWISGAASYPHDYIRFLTEGHTVNLEFPGNTNFTAAILTDRLTVFPEHGLGEYRGSVIKLLWLVPITTAERNLAMDEGSEKLILLLEEIGKSVFALERSSVV